MVSTYKDYIGPPASCGICLQDNPPDMVYHDGLGLLHPNCRKCIAEWAKSKNICPTCKCEVNNETLMPLKDRVKIITKEIATESVMGPLLCATTVAGVGFSTVVIPTGIIGGAGLLADYTASGVGAAVIAAGIGSSTFIFMEGVMVLGTAISFGMLMNGRKKTTSLAAVAGVIGTAALVTLNPIGCALGALVGGTVGALGSRLWRALS